MNYVSEIAQRIRREVPHEVLPEGDTDLLFLMYAVLTLTVGDKVQAEDVHDTWSAWMTYRDPSHESIKPFTQLSSRMKKTDQPFVDAIKKVATRLPYEETR
jgi:hypothetical protein